MIPFEKVPSTEGRDTIDIVPESFASFRPPPPDNGQVIDNNQIVYDLFLPGPVYFHALVNRSLIDGFRTAAENQNHPSWRDLPIKYAVWKFKRPIVANCGEWNNLLCAMDRQSFVYFKQWMGGIHFVDRGRKLVFMTLFEQAAILDPFLLDSKNQGVPEHITVMCPVCKDWHVKPSTFAGIEKSKAPAKIELEFVKPLPEMLRALEELADELRI